MRFAAFAALFGVGAMGCGLALNGLESNDSGASEGGGGAHGDASSSGGAVSGSGGSSSGGLIDGGGPGGEVDAGAHVGDASPPDANDAATEPDATSTYELDVPATDGPSCASWFDTGIAVAQGDQVTFTATGTWNYAGSFFSCGPDGSAMGGTMSGFNYGALVGETGGGAPFAVGTSTAMTVTTPGRLAFGINDGYCGDNAGSLHVVVTVRP